MASSSTATASASTSLTTMSNSNVICKGKITHRSWSQLPPEVIRLITTHYLLDFCSKQYSPRTWDSRGKWHQRLVYTIFRDAVEVEKLMCVCPAWGTANEKHLFWQQACMAIDPTSSMSYLGFHQPTAGSTMPVMVPFTPYRTFRNITNISCWVCRINYPYRNLGLGCAKRSMHNPYFKTVNICKEHRKEHYCGLCLREVPSFENDNDPVAVLGVENDDVDSWPGIHTTCRNCREEWLWRRVVDDPKERAAVGAIDGHKWDSEDWETRQAVDSFLDIGEGGIQDVINIAMDKQWLRKFTKLSDMLDQALAASRFMNREVAGYNRDDDASSVDEEDPEMLSFTEENGGVKDLALNDWARNRILDGHWINPADQWYGFVDQDIVRSVKSIHPTPWNRDSTYEGAMDDSQSGEVLEHPRPNTRDVEVPPSFTLCEKAFMAFQKQMKLILLPAMRNVVRRLVIEGGADGVDPTIRATKMTLEDVMKELREESSWYNGIDWLERRANGEREMRSRAAKDDDDELSSSSKSSGSHTTSPVLSTTTLQTTPSPPASIDGRDVKKDDDLNTRSRAIPVIPITPVLETPVLVHPIPYVPETTSHLSQYSLESIKTVWREACEPLYHCRCSVCERATFTANVAAGNVVPSQAPVPPTLTSELLPPSESPVEIKLDEAPIDATACNDVEALREEEEESAEDEDEEEDWEVCAVNPRNPRKRPSHDLDSDDEDDAAGGGALGKDHTLQKRRSGSFPKRLRREEDYVKDKPVASPTRLQKRSSKELNEDKSNDDGFEADGREVATKKKLRVDTTASEEEVTSPPLSITGTGDSDSVTPTGDDEDPDLTSGPQGVAAYAQLPRGLKTDPVGIIEAEMDNLYTFESPGTVTTRDGEVDA